MVGLQRAKEFVFFTQELGAEEAWRLGIMFTSHERERLLDEALALAARFHDASTEAIGIAKNILNRAFDLDSDSVAELEACAQALAMETGYHRMQCSGS